MKIRRHLKTYLYENYPDFNTIFNTDIRTKMQKYPFLKKIANSFDFNSYALNREFEALKIIVKKEIKKLFKMVDNYNKP